MSMLYKADSSVSQPTNGLSRNRLSTSILKSTVSMALTGLVIGMTPAFGATVYNYGENLTPLKQAYSNGRLHILQIGDSHTAGDYFTEQLRKRLQADIGDGGLGFAYASKLKGQRNARHGYSSSWHTSNSRSNRSGGDYPLGGVYASPSSRSNKLTLTSQYYAGDTQQADIVAKGRAGQTLTLSNRHGTQSIRLPQSGWQSVPASITFPTSIQADSNVKVGGFWLNKGQGGLVSAMGINGATQDYWRRWRSDLSQGLSFSNANLVILAYGTNEAFRGKRSNVVTLKQYMNDAIRDIRQGLPNANILVVGAPESLKSTSGSCGVRANYLDTVQSQLQQVAQENRTLYWSWQDAMGGSCSMKTWVNRGLAARDGVHFTRKGYSSAANDLYDGLKQVLNTNNSYQFSGNRSTFTKPANPANNVKQAGLNEDYESTRKEFTNRMGYQPNLGKHNYGRSYYQPRNNTSHFSNNYPQNRFMNSYNNSYYYESSPTPYISNEKKNTYVDMNSGQICDKNGKCVRF